VQPATAAPSDHAKIDLADQLGAPQLGGFGRGLGLLQRARVRAEQAAMAISMPRACAPADKSRSRKILTKILSVSEKAVSS
jgi:hypothetical protein